MFQIKIIHYPTDYFNFIHGPELTNHFIFLNIYLKKLQRDKLILSIIFWNHNIITLLIKLFKYSFTFLILVEDIT